MMYTSRDLYLAASLRWPEYQVNFSVTPEIINLGPSICLTANTHSHTQPLENAPSTSRKRIGGYKK